MILEDVSLNLDKMFVIEAFDEDTVSDTFIGQMNGLKIDSLVKTNNVQEFDEQLNNKKGKKSGSCTFSVRYIWEEPDAPLVPRDENLKPLNKKCKMIVNVIDATFNKNSDLFGNQDPYVRFKYGRGSFETTVKYKAGKYAKWNEKFELNNINRWIENGDSLELEAMEKDVGSSDFLGGSKPLELKGLAASEGVARHDMELFDEDKKQCGRVKFTTEFKWVEYVPEPPTDKLDYKTMIKIIVIDATFLKDGDTFGK